MRERERGGEEGGETQTIYCLQELNIFNNTEGTHSLELIYNIGNLKEHKR